MRLARYALAFGLGYAAGHPAGREKLRTVPTQVNELAHRPEAERLKERGKALAEQAVQGAKQRLGRGTADGDEAGNGQPPTGRTRPTTVEETVVVTETTGTGTTGTGTTRARTTSTGTSTGTTGAVTAVGEPGRKGGTDVGTSSAAVGEPGRSGGTDVGTSSAVGKDVKKDTDKNADKNAAMHGTLPPTSGRGSSPR